MVMVTLEMVLNLFDMNYDSFTWQPAQRFYQSITSIIYHSNGACNRQKYMLLETFYAMRTRA